MIDGPIAPLPCLSRTAYRKCDDCPSEELCAVRAGFAEAYDASLRVLEATTIAQAMKATAGNEATYARNPRFGGIKISFPSAAL